MKKKSKSSFKDKVARNVQHQRDSKKGFGYLDLPKGVPILSLEEDLTRIDLDFLPYEVTDTKHPDRDEQFEIAVEGTLWYRRPFKVHRSVGADNDTVVCLRSVGKPCPICEYREKRAKEGADKDEIKELYAKPRSLYIVIPIGIKKFKEVPTVWDMSDYLLQDILNDELDLNPEDRDFCDLETGKTATLKLKWKKFGSASFPDVRSIDFEERDPYDESVLDKVPNLDEILKILSYSTIEAKFFEIEHESDGGELHDIKDEEDEKPVRRKKVVEDDDDEEAPVRRRKKVVEEEPEEEPPVRRKKVVEDDDDEKPVRRKKVVEEEPEEAPKKSSKDRCPHGHRFGVDTEKFDECDTCDIWSECLDVKEGK